MTGPAHVVVEFLNPNQGKLSVKKEDVHTPVWSRIKVQILAHNLDAIVSDDSIQLLWSDTLNLIRQFGARDIQRALNFRLAPVGQAVDRLTAFSKEVSTAQSVQHSSYQAVDLEELASRLRTLGFTKRELKKFQLRDLARLLALSNGANFSVPGAGKTTVTFALHLLARQPGQHLMVVAPKAAYQAWQDIVSDCIEDAEYPQAEPFTLLDGTEEQNAGILASGATRFIVSYDLIIRQQSLIANYLARTVVHLVLDESHRMKAGLLSQRGQFLLSIATLAKRRDILTGTPMPQSGTDIQSQLDFLWPGHGLGLQVARGNSPKSVLGNLYVRTTKTELGLKTPHRHFVDVTMKPGQLALYSIVRNELLRNYSKRLTGTLNEGQLLKARRSVMRLLQLSVNPILALAGIGADDMSVPPGIVDAVVEEGNSAKLEAVMAKARSLVDQGKKVVIWTMFTQTILSLESTLADLNPVVLFGEVPNGSKDDLTSREGRIHRFHVDPECSVLIANPAAAGEGISLHTVCHDALYADRSYVSTHYLQSIDRIHRLGLPPGQTTDIYIYRSKAPPEIGSIDLSVSRRLAEKVRNMQVLLDDPDLHEIAYDEEEADDPVDYDVSMQDLFDLIAELEGRADEAFVEA